MNEPDPLPLLVEAIQGLRVDVQNATEKIESATQQSIREGLKIERRRRIRWMTALAVVVLAASIVLWSVHAADARSQRRDHIAEVERLDDAARATAQHNHDICESTNTARLATRANNADIFAGLRSAAAGDQRALTSIAAIEGRVNARVRLHQQIVTCPAAPK